MSKRLNEQGTVIMRVLIGTDGQQQAEIRSSGFRGSTIGGNHGP